METLPFQPQRLARTGPRRNAQHHWTIYRGHLHPSAVHCLIKRHRQVQPHIIAVALEEGMRLYFYGDECIACPAGSGLPRSAEHTSELQSLMRISYAVFCLKKKK